MRFLCASGLTRPLGQIAETMASQR
jgi:hypothetical protein